MNLLDLAGDPFARLLEQERRALRLRFAGALDGHFDGVLLAQRLHVAEAVCEGITLHLTCLASRADLPLQALVGLPIEVQLVTDQGVLRRFCAVVTEVRQGQSDGALTVVQLTARDVLAIMDGRRGDRLFLEQSVVDIARSVLDGWRRRFPALGRCFDWRLLGIDEARYPRRAQTFQARQSDTAFLRGLLAREGIGWFVRPAAADGDGATPAHELVLFDDARALPANAAGTVRYHRRDGTEPRDSVDLLAPLHALVPGSVARASWDHESARVDRAEEAVRTDQGEAGDALAAALRDARIERPHDGDSADDFRRLTHVAVQRHEARAHSLHGQGGVRAQAAGEYNRIDGHPALGGRPEEREYVSVKVEHWADNNLPKTLGERAQALLAADDATQPGAWAPPAQGAHDGAQRYANRFVAVRRDASLAPVWDAQADLPPMPLMTGSVAGVEGTPVWCDALGRVKVHFHGLEPVGDGSDGEASKDGNAGDSAWVRVNWLWCGEGFGIVFPLRPGMEVSIGFEMGDPSRPMIVGSRYNAASPPPRFDGLGSLPANHALSGIVTRELGGSRGQQLRFDDTHGRIGVQLASDHAAAQLNLGALATPMRDGQSEPRGEGAELRSDAAVAVRGGRGVLISSAAQPQAGGAQLERAELLGLAQALQSVVEQLGTLAERHHAGATDAERLRRLVGHLRDWDKGSTTDPRSAGGGAPVVAVSAAAGAAVASQDSLLLGAQTTIDAISAGHTQLSAGGQIRQRAAAGLSAFAQRGGIEAVAAEGMVNVEAHQGDIRLTASGTLTLTAGTKVVIQAPEVEVIGQGAATRWAGGSIAGQAQGPFVVRSASFAQSGPAGAVPEGVRMPASASETDEKFVLCLRGTDRPVAGRRYRIELDGGSVVEGRTDAQGRTALAQSDALGIAGVTLFDD